MKLRDLFKQIEDAQKASNASAIYICGGTPRDRYMNQLNNVSDIDLTTGDKSIQNVFLELSKSLKQNYNITTKQMTDHSSIYVGNLKLDFSSNYNAPNIESILKTKNIFNPSPLQKEMYSRDFNCNALLLSLDLKTILDPTDQGLKDIKDKKIRTCLSPEITLSATTSLTANRIPRAIYLACKLGFDIDQSIVDYVAKNPKLIQMSSVKSLNEKLNFAFEKDPERAIHYVTKMNLWDYVPISKTIYPFYQKYKNVKSASVKPFMNNYDLYDVKAKNNISPGAGWHSMNKYKSIADFLKAKRKKKKASLDDLLNKYADFAIDNQINDPIMADDPTNVFMFDMTPQHAKDDELDQSADNLNFSRVDTGKIDELNDLLGDDVEEIIEPTEQTLDLEVEKFHDLTQRNYNQRDIGNTSNKSYYSIIF